MPNNIVIPFTAGLNSWANLVWALNKRYRPILVYVTNLFPHSCVDVELKCIKDVTDHVFDSWDGSHMMMRGELPFQISHNPVFIITLSDEELLRLETHTTPAVYRWGLLAQKLATVAKSVKLANSTNSTVVATYAYPRAIRARIGDHDSRTPYQTTKSTSSVNILWPLENLTPSIYCEEKFTLVTPDFKNASPFTYVSSWVDATTDAQEETNRAANDDMIDEDVVGEMVEYCGSFEHSFNPWDSVALCHVDTKTLQDRRDHSGCVLEHVCGSCRRCAEFVRLYGEHYGSPVVEMDRPVPGLFSTPLAVVPRIL
jgi:hypothetical protein